MTVPAMLVGGVVLAPAPAGAAANPNPARNRVRRWYVKHTLAGGVGDAYFDYGDDAPYPY